MGGGAYFAIPKTKMEWWHENKVDKLAGGNYNVTID
jgi:hypothetical protein